MVEKRKNPDIRNILVVLVAAVIGAGLLSSIFLYYYGPFGRYLAGNTLLDPSIIEQINYQDQHPRTGKKVRFAFDRIEFSYFDTQMKQMHTFPISLEIYHHFYKKITSVKSLLEINQKTQNLFLQSYPALLTISMQSKESAENGAAKVFQIVQFIPEDYFRVQLHEKNEEWAYFYQAGIYQDIIYLFTKGTSEK